MTGLALATPKKCRSPMPLLSIREVLWLGVFRAISRVGLKSNVLISMPVLHNVIIIATAIAEQLSATTGLLNRLCNDVGNIDRILNMLDSLQR